MGFLLRIHGVGLVLLIGVLHATQMARAAGFVSLETTGFLRESAAQGDSSTWLKLGPKLRGESASFEAELDLEAAMYLNSATMPGQAGSRLAVSSLTIESRDTFIATAPAALGGHQFTLGRRHQVWSRADEDWKLGLWSPRFMWDPLRPESLGLTGLFYGFSGGGWRVSAFASPVAIPERGAPILEQDGELRSPSRDFSTPYGGAIVMNELVDIRYRLERPSIRELVLHPGAALKLAYEPEDGGLSASVSAAQLPVGNLDAIAQARLAPGSEYIDALLRPRVRTHRVATAELGYRASAFETWVSATVERPLDAPAVAGDWMSDPIGGAWIASGGARIRPTRHLTLSASQLWVEERQAAAPDSELSLDLPSRFPYTQAFRLGGEYGFGPRWSSETYWIRDFASRGHQLSVALAYGGQASETDRWRAKIGADLFWGAFSDTGVGRYVGNDRIWGKLSYAF